MTKIEKLAYKIVDFLKKNNCEKDTSIYFENKCIRSGDIDNIVQNINPLEYIEYANPNTITMAFEGNFNHAMNYGIGGWHIEKKFTELCKKYGYYYEFGYAWSLSLYEIPPHIDKDRIMPQG